MRRVYLTCSLFVALVFGTISSAHAQPFNISWYKIAGGGGTSTGGNFTVTGTVGQAEAGSMSGGQFSLTGGFWGIIAVVQTPGAPLLTIARTIGNQVVLSWPAASTGFVLQQNPVVNNTNTWSGINTNTFPIVVSNGTNTVTLPVSGNDYFRLVTP